MSDAAAYGGLADAEPNRIVVIRRGETDWTAEARLQGQTDAPRRHPHRHPHRAGQPAQLADGQRRHQPRLRVTPQGVSLIGLGDSAHLDALARDEPGA